MAMAAAECALRMARVSVDDIASISLTTLTQDFVGPFTGTEVHRRLGAPENCRTVELMTACAGGVAALRDAASELLLNPNAQAALAIGSEKMSAMLNDDDRRSVILFGDGAGAAVLQRVGFAEAPVFSFATRPDREAIYAPAGGVVEPGRSADDPRRKLRMNGKQVAAHAGYLMPKVLLDVVHKDGALNAEGSIDWDRYDVFIPHQANGKMIEALWDALKVPEEKRILTVDQQGNTSSASVLLALQAAYEKGMLQQEEGHGRVLMTSVGAGMIAAACAIDVKLPQYF